MKKQKVYERRPNITYEDAIVLHNNSIGCTCKTPFIVEKPGSSIEKTSFFSFKFFHIETWICLRCKWESNQMIKRDL